MTESTMKDALSVILGLFAGLLVGMVLSNLLLVTDWEQIFASPAVICTVLGAGLASRLRKKKNK